MLTGLKAAGRMANSVDFGQALQNVAFDLGVYFFACSSLFFLITSG